MVAIDPKIAGAAVDAVFRKLICAFHYKHTGEILQADAVITGEVGDERGAARLHD